MSFSLTVTQSELLPALKTLSGVVEPTQASQAVLTHKDGMLTISLPGASVDVPAQGTWPGLVRFSGLFLLSLARVPPRGDPLIFKVSRGRFRVSTSSVDCSVEEVKQKPNLEVPLDASLSTLVRVHLTNDYGDIERAGLDPLVKKAIERRNELIEEAAEILAPLEISAAALRALVNDYIIDRKKYEP
jgi:hypothetical protein